MNTMGPSASVARCNVSLGRGNGNIAPGGRACDAGCGGIESAVTALYDIWMPTIHRQQGWKVQIFANDHAPPHAHVVSAGHKVVVEISSASVIKGTDASARALADAVAWISANRARLLAEWNRIVERDDERGPTG